MKKRSYRYGINTLRTRHGTKYTKYNILSEYDNAYMYLTKLKQHLKLKL